MNSGKASATLWRADNFSASENAATAEPAACRWHVATLRYLTDLDREVSIPIGVVLFAEGIPLWGIRTPQEGESLPGLSPESLPGIVLMRDLLLGWLTSGELPYATNALTPYSLAWWRHLAGLLGHRVRLEATRPTLCETPSTDIETLYQVIVRPTDKVGRTDTAVRRSAKGAALAKS